MRRKVIEERGQNIPHKRKLLYVCVVSEIQMKRSDG